MIMTTSLFSVAVFAIPASMITWGFEAEATYHPRRSYALSITVINYVPMN